MFETALNLKGAVIIVSLISCLISNYLSSQYTEFICESVLSYDCRQNRPVINMHFQRETESGGKFVLLCSDFDKGQFWIFIMSGLEHWF